MPKSTSALFTLSLLLTTFGFAKDKPKNTLPFYVLHARTVAVIVDPEAGVSIEDPQANQVAQKDVEKALLSWGRFEPVLSTQSADLIIVVHRGHGRLAEQTISDPRQNSRPGMINTTDNSATIGVQHGQPPNQANQPNVYNPESAQETVHPQTEIGTPDDSFTVFQGGVQSHLDGSPAWRYVAKDGLRPHSVPAVEQFRKALAEADKAAAKNP
jgi:hypothetical protein